MEPKRVPQNQALGTNPLHLLAGYTVVAPWGEERMKNRRAVIEGLSLQRADTGKLRKEIIPEEAGLRPLVGELADEALWAAPRRWNTSSTVRKKMVLGEAGPRLLVGELADAALWGAPQMWSTSRTAPRLTYTAILQCCDDLVDEVLWVQPHIRLKMDLSLVRQG